MNSVTYWWYQALMFFGWRSKFSKQMMAPIPENVKEDLRRRSREGTLPQRCVWKGEE